MKIKSLLLGILLCVLLLGFSGCNKLENVTNSSVKLILWSLTGVDKDGADTTTILSDVLTKGSIFNDNVTGTFTSVLLDPTKVGASDSTFYQHVIIDQVDVKFTRADGLNIEGVDVPYGFSQKVYLTLDTGETTESSLSFILIQHNAKLESPLVELVNLGQEHVLKLEAKITFYARDLAGNRLEPAVGSISIWCSNFADPE